MKKNINRRNFIKAVSAAGAVSLIRPAPVAGAARGAAMTEATPKPLSSFDGQVRELISRMTLEEKIGQMTQPEQDALKDVRDIEKYFVGSLLSGGNSDPMKNGAADNSLTAWTDMYDSYQTHALKTRLRIPILYGVDAVHGHNNVLGAVVFPHNIGLGCTRNAELIERAARITAVEVRATGIQWTFAPCVTVARDERWGRTYEGFGETPELAAVLGAAAVRGLQGADLSDPQSVLACAKHFLGDGGTLMGTGTFGEAEKKKPLLDQGDTRLTEKELRELHLQGYVTAIKAGVGSVMPSYSSWNGVKVSGSERLLTGVLKKELGFEGFLISDYNAVDQITKDYKQAIAISINAGMDMVMVPKTYREFFDHLLANVKEGQVPASRIDDAVARILRVKFAMGMMDKNRSQLADRSLHQKFGSAEHRRVARECVRQSLVLLKNGGKVLPLAKRAARIHVAGKNADDLGNQCGGWTIDWQGKSGEVMPGGTTVLRAIRDTASAGTKVTFSKDGTGAGGADVAVVVVGETPYAEGVGDREDLSLAAEDVAAIMNAKKAGVPVVAVLITGRPLILEGVLNECDAVVAAWLPGTEGQGVADVLFGDYAPTGKLSFSWPRSTAQLPINEGDKNYDPLFKYGFGLTY